MEYVNCNLCGANDAKSLFRTRYRNSKEQRLFQIVKCRKCSLVYLNPRPTQEEIRAYYPDWYHCRAWAGTVDLEKTEVWGTPWREVMAKKAAPILRHKRKGKILDVGCGDGSLLKYMQELGWQTYGVEFHDVSARYAREVLGLNVFSGKLAEADYPEGTFDVITLFHVLEHLADPLKALEKIYALLAQHGVLLIEVPNFGGFEAQIFRSKWARVAAPLHLYHFTPRTLELVLKKSGFTPVRLEFVSPAYKYAAGYSESLRNCLADVGLYPSREKWVAAMEGGQCPGARIIFRGKPWHFLENLVFSTLASIMDKIGWGSSVLVTARKENIEVKK